MFINAQRDVHVARLNATYRDQPPEEILRLALSGLCGPVAMVSSFGAESVVLLHMVAQIDRATPILFLDTQMLFPETLAYQRDVAAYLGLTDLRIQRPDPKALMQEDPDGLLHRRDTDACCDLRKTRVLQQALRGFDGWITGRKRFQAGTRAALKPFEAEATRFKINPLADWQAADIAGYMARYDLPRHPLVAQGYPSIGCAPCTSPVRPGEDPRAGRWRNQSKTECGIHLSPTRPPLEGDTPCP